MEREGGGLGWKGGRRHLVVGYEVGAGESGGVAAETVMDGCVGKGVKMVGRYERRGGTAYRRRC